MSQSDYIRYKRVSVELESQTKLKPVLDAGKYTAYKEYSLENSIISTPTYDNRLPPNISVIFDMRLNTSTNCRPPFILCSDTDERPNRELRSFAPPQPLKPKPAHVTLDKLLVCKRRLCFKKKQPPLDTDN